MKESFWGIFVVGLGILSIFFIVLFQSLTNTDEHNSQLLKEVTEAAMWDAFDYASFRANGTVRIYREKFVENFNLVYFKCTNIEYHEETGLISKLVFEQIDE